MVFRASSPSQMTAPVRLDVDTRRVAAPRRVREVALDPGDISEPKWPEFPTTGGLTAHGPFYPPRNHAYAGPAGKRPPLLVMSHGGSTASTGSALRPGTQYGTSRGIAVLDVDYGGSRGYGPHCRQRLNGQWGVVDVDNCVNGTRDLVARGRVDSERLAITGGNAGG